MSRSISFELNYEIPTLEKRRGKCDNFIKSDKKHRNGVTHEKKNTRI